MANIFKFGACSTRYLTTRSLRLHVRYQVERSKRNFHISTRPYIIFHLISTRNVLAFDQVPSFVFQPVRIQKQQNYGDTATSCRTSREEEKLKVSRRFIFDRDLFNSLKPPCPRKEIRIGLRCTISLSILSSSIIQAGDHALHTHA